MRKLFSIFGMLALCAMLFAQTPSAFKYQAVARNQSGEVMADQPMSIRISVLKGAQVEYSEVHSITTNDLGLFTVEVGRGSPISGTFFDIVWNEDPHFIRVEVDPNGGSNFVYLGISELLTVPYAMHAETVTYNDDADADPDNEIQDLKVVGGFLRITNNPNPTQIDLSQFDTDAQQISYDADNFVLSLENGGSVNLQTLMEDADANPTNELQTVVQVGSIVTLSQGGGTFSVEDADANPSNELQSLSQVGNTVTLSQGGGSVTITEVDGDPSNELQDLEFNNNYLYITGQSNPNIVNLNHLLDNTDAQQLAYDLVTGNLALTDGGVVNLSSLEDDADADATNELQTISRVGDDIVLSHNGGTVNIEDGDSDDTNEIQTVSQNGLTVTLSNGGGSFTIADDDNSIVNEIQDLMVVGDSLVITNNPSATVIDLGVHDNQTLNFSTLTYELTIANGNTVDLTDLKDDDDSNPLNEIQDLYLSNDSLVISNNPWATIIDMSPYLDNTDAQDMSLSGNTLSLTGDATTVNLTPYLDNTDTQDMSISGNTLSITGDATTVDLTPFMDNTDAQTISIANDSMFISGGNVVDLAPYLDNTDAQDMTLTGNTLSITGDASTVDLAPYLDNTDAQTISITNDSMFISGGNTVDLAAYLDNTDAQDMTLTGNTLSITGDASTVDLAPYLDNTDAQTISITNDSMFISGGNTVDLAAYLDNTDAQDMTLTGNTLSITGDASTVDLAPYLDNTDAQTVSISNDSLIISGGNAIDLASFLDADNMGDHAATQNISISTHYMSNDGDSEGIRITTNGNVIASGDFFVGETAGSNSDAYISGRLYDWDNSSYYVDPNFQSHVTDLRVTAGVIVNTGGVTVSAGGITVTGNSIVTGTFGATGVVTAPSFVSTIATGTAPMTIASTTLVSNLNADLIDGLSSAAFVQGANNLSDISDASVARTNLGVAIGTDVQGYDAGLASIAGLVTVADKMVYTTGADVYATTDLTAFGRTFLGSATAAAGATTLGLGTTDSPTFTGVTATGNGSVGGTFGVTGVSTLGSDLTVNGGDIDVDDDKAFYFGGKTTTGSWRIVRSLTDLSFEQYDGAIWVQKFAMVP